MKMSMALGALVLGTSVHAADVTAVKTLTGNKDVRFVWTNHQSGPYEYSDPTSLYKLWVLDTRDNQERQLAPGGKTAADNYADPLIVAGGSKIVYSVSSQKKVYVIDWNGQNNTFLVNGVVTSQASINGTQWIYYQSAYHGPISRITIDGSKTELVYNQSEVGCNGTTAILQPWFHVSGDGKRSIFDAPWPSIKMAVLPATTGNSVVKNYPVEGCWNAITPDNTYHSWVFTSNHNSVIVFDSTLVRPGGGSDTVWLGTCFGVDKRSTAMNFHKWTANDANFVTMTGPGIGSYETDNPPQPGDGQLWLGKMTNWRTISWVKITNTATYNCWNDAWVGDVAGSDTSTVSAPVFSATATTFTDSVVVSISTVTAGASIYYTTDGSTPTASSTPYGTTPLVIRDTRTLSAIAVKTGKTSSVVTSTTYTKISVAPPTVSPASGAFIDSVRVTITGGDTIYYSTNGADPTRSSLRYANPFWLKTTATVKARVYNSAGSSAVVSARLVINAIKVTAPNGGNALSVGQTVAITWTADTVSVTGAAIHVSVDNGLTWIPIVTSGIPVGAPQWSNYPWTIPDTIFNGPTPVSTISTQVRIKVEQYGMPSVNDVSDAVFSIKPAVSARSQILPQWHGDKVVRVEIYDLSGALRARAVVAATGPFVFGATDPGGRRLACGTYLMRVVSDKHSRVTRVSIGSPSTSIVVR